MNNSTPSTPLQTKPEQPSRSSTQHNETKPSCTTFTFKDLYNYLYRKNEVKALSHEEIQRERRKLVANKYWCEVCQYEGTATCTRHGPEHSKPKPTPHTKHKPSSAIASFPSEVQLCSSSIPGSKYGVITKCYIPKGTWLGPYEGTRVRPEGVTLGTDATYMWEIFNGGQLSFYLDGSDEDKSSWMRFISCARNSAEQNLYAFQYCGNIYYRAFKEIPPGTELLVWYDEIYPQFMGIPLEIREMEGIYQRAGDSSKKNSQVVVVVPPEVDEPSTTTTSSRNELIDLHVVNPETGVGPSSTNSARPTTSTVNSNPMRALHQTNSGLTTTGQLPDTRQGLPWQQAGYKVTPTAASVTGPRTTSELLKRRRKRASTGRAELPWQRAGTAPAPPGSELLLKRSKSGGDLTFRQHMSMSSAAPGSHTRVQPRLLEGSEGNLTAGEQHSDPYNLHIQIEPSSETNLLLGNRRFSDKNERAGDGVGSAADSGKTFERINSDDNAFKCGQCGKTFPQRSVLQIHVCPKAPYKPYHCGHCSQLFSDPNELRNHAVIHINEKPFKCGYCSRSFSGATTLNNHIRTHTGEKPFECSVCGKTFSQASQLSRHEKIPGDCVRK